MIISRTPLRMSFAGGGSDFKGYYSSGFGSVLSSSIGKYIYVNVSKGFNDKIWVNYSKTEYVDNVDEIEHNLIREAMKIVGIKKGVNISYFADLLPAHEGSGLGASSGLTVGILHALYRYINKSVSKEQLAKEACEIEIERLGHPMGKQDQYGTALGGINYIRFNKDESVDIEPILLDKSTIVKLNRKLLLFYTNMKSSSKDVLPEQEKKIIKTSPVIDKMVQLSIELKKSLQNKTIEDFGKILHKGWEYKRQLANKISNDFINECYEKAIEAGADGGKILGSGGGGFLLVFADESKQENVKKALSDLDQCEFTFDEDGTKIAYVD